jgi:hypothetical protein
MSGGFSIVLLIFLWSADSSARGGMVHLTYPACRRESVRQSPRLEDWPDRRSVVRARDYLPRLHSARNSSCYLLGL